jgi:hypothetical protein
VGFPLFRCIPHSSWLAIKSKNFLISSTCLSCNLTIRIAQSTSKIPNLSVYHIIGLSTHRPSYCALYACHHGSSFITHVKCLRPPSDHLPTPSRPYKPTFPWTPYTSHVVYYGDRVLLKIFRRRGTVSACFDCSFS